MSDPYSENLDNMLRYTNYLGEDIILIRLGAADPADPTTLSSYMELTGEAGAGTSGQTTFNNFLNTFNKTGTPLPTSWADFLTKWRQYYVETLSITSSTSSDTFDKFSNEFSFAAGINATDNSAGTDHILDIISPSSIDTAAYFQSAFSEFLKSYKYQNNGSVGNGSNFMRNWIDFLSYTAKIDASSQFTTINDISTADLIANYTGVYNAYSSGLTNPPLFGDEFRDYFFSYVAQHGYWHTGRALSGWVQKMDELFLESRERAGRLIVAKTEDNYLFPGTIIAKVSPGFSTFGITLQNLEAGDQFTITLASNMRLYDLGNTAGAVVTPTLPVNGPITVTITIPVTPSNGSSFQFTLDSPLGNASVDEWNQTFRSITYNRTDQTPPTLTKTVNLPNFGGIHTFTPKELAEITSNDLHVVSVHTSVTSDHTKRVMILQRIFKLIASLIGTLQLVTAAQSEQIRFLTTWQRAFTDLITEVKTFTRGDATVFGRFVDVNYEDAENEDPQVDADAAAKDQNLQGIRSDANQNALNKREQQSAWRSIVSDTAKREQTRLNQSNDAVSQQANMATAILQQLSTILGTIFR